MKSNRLESDQVRSSGDGGRDGGGPRRVVVDHLARAPLSISYSSRYESDLINLELYVTIRRIRLRPGRVLGETYPFKRSCVDPVAGRATTLSHVGELVTDISGSQLGTLNPTYHGALRVRPDLVPIRGNFGTSSDRSRLLASWA